MADECDIADPFIEKERAERVKAVQARIPVGESRKECRRCGEPIPEERRQAAPGCIYCVDCQSLHERL